EAPESLWPSLREAFGRAGYEGGILDEAEAIASGQVEHVRAPMVRWALLARGRADATLAALFVYGAVVERARLADALGSALVDTLLGLGVLVAEGAGLAAALRVTPYNGVWILCDDLWRDGDPVMGPSMTTE